MNGKILIAYYSHSGNTEKIAELIKNITKGKLLKIQPVKPYTSSYNKVVMQARKEINLGFMPDIINNIENLDSYEIIFIGTPNWCSSIAPPVAKFLSENDFTNKTIIPFCTNGGGGCGRIESEIKRLSNGAEVKECLGIYGDGGSNAEDIIKKWIGGRL